MAHLRKGHRWPEYTLVYKFSEKIWDKPGLRQRIEDVMVEIRGLCGLKFRYRDNEDHYVLFRLKKKERGSSSDVGRESSHLMFRARQEINLYETASLRTIRHEILHAIGFYHEQQRRDRNSNVMVFKRNMTEEEYNNNFKAPDSDDSRSWGTYDFDSIMHYNSSGGVYNWSGSNWRNVKSILIAGTSYIIRKDNFLGSLESLRIIDSSICDSIATKASRTEFDTVIPYSIDANNHFVFQLSSINGQMQIIRLNNDGTFGNVTDNRGWTPGWTVAGISDSVSGNTFLAIVKTNGGQLHIHKMNPNGTVGERTSVKNWSDNYVHCVFATYDNTRTFMILMKAAGIINIHQIFANGELSDRMHHYNWSSDYTSVLSWRSRESVPRCYLFFLKAKNGVIKIHRIAHDGSLGTAVYQTNWSKDYTNCCVFENGVGQRRLFLNKFNSGVGHVHVLNSNGTIGDELNPHTMVRRDTLTSLPTNDVFSLGDIEALRYLYPI